MMLSDFPDLVAQFHPTLNGELRPEDVQAGAGTIVWWHCPLGTDHDWASQVRSRTLRGTGCRFCAGRAFAARESLAVTHPDLAAEWHPTRNGSKNPADVTFGSHFEAWWQCPRYRSHVWRSRVSSRTSMMTTCSLCSGRARPDAVEASREEAARLRAEGVEDLAT